MVSALLPIGGVPILNHWMGALKSVPRLLPIQEKVRGSPVCDVIIINYRYDELMWVVAQ